MLVYGKTTKQMFTSTIGKIKLFVTGGQITFQFFFEKEWSIISLLPQTVVVCSTPSCVASAVSRWSRIPQTRVFPAYEAK